MKSKRLMNIIVIHLAPLRRIDASSQRTGHARVHHVHPLGELALHLTKHDPYDNDEHCMMTMTSMIMISITIE